MRTLTTLTAAALTTLAFASPGALEAQNVSLEVRGSLTKGVGDFGDVANSDAGLGADVFFAASPNLSVYGGYSRDMFGCDGCGDDDGYRSSGFEAGAKLLAARESGVLPWLKGGATLHRLTVEDDGTEFDSDRNLGFQLAAGVDIPLGEVLSFSPAVRYQNYDAEFDAGPLDDISTQNVSYVTADFGLHLHFQGLSSN